MALAFDRVVALVLDGVTIASTASATSAEQALGDDTIFDQEMGFFLTVTGWDAAPAGNEQLIVTYIPMHETGGTEFDDSPQTWALPTTADQQYDFERAITRLHRFHKWKVTNDTGQDIDPDTLSLWAVRIDATA